MYLLYKTDEPYHFDRIRSEEKKNRRKRHGWGVVTPTAVGDRLKELRERMGSTQAEMAELIRSRCYYAFELDKRKYQRWEHGKSLKRFLKPTNLLMLSFALCVPLSYFTETRIPVPPLWNADEALLNPTKARGDEAAWGRKMYLYRVEAKHRGDRQTFYVIESSRDAVRQTFIEEKPGAIIDTVKQVKWKPGVVD